MARRARGSAVNRTATPPSPDIQGNRTRRERVRPGPLALVGQHAGRRTARCRPGPHRWRGHRHQCVSDHVSFLTSAGSDALLTAASCAPLRRPQLIPGRRDEPHFTAAASPPRCAGTHNRGLCTSIDRLQAAIPKATPSGSTELAILRSFGHLELPFGRKLILGDLKLFKPITKCPLVALRDRGNH
jgi:hypothetical protein